MAKKSRKRVHRRVAKKSKKRVTRRPAKKSWWEKLFTFPKLAVYLFVLLSVFTVYQVTKSQDNVLGETSTASVGSYKLKLNMYSINRKSESSCLAKTFKIKVKDGNGKVTNYTIVGNNDCSKFASPVIKLKGKCNWVSYESNLANWSLFEIKYSDSKKDPGYVYNSNKAQVCYYSPSEGLSVPAEVFVEFGMKAK